VKEYDSTATDEQIRKVLGIKYPGAERPTATTEKIEKKPSEKKPALLWPENLMQALVAETTNAEKEGNKPESVMELSEHLNDDQLEGVRFAISTLLEREQTVIHLRFEEQRRFREVGEALDISASRAQQICAKALRKLRHPSRFRFIQYGYQGVLSEKSKSNGRDDPIRRVDYEHSRDLNDISVFACDLTERVASCLSRAGIQTLGELVGDLEKSPKILNKVHNLGTICLIEVIEKLEEYGVDCTRFRIMFDFNEKYAVRIEELDPTVRLFSILKRAGLDTVEKIRWKILRNPEDILKLRNMGSKSVLELTRILERVGVDCTPLWKALQDRRKARVKKTSIQN
jgi:RNA polymerase sigma factor (sigma-70 family)